MPSARGKRRAASSLVRSDKDCRDRCGKPYPCDEERLKLRIRARGREDDVDVLSERQLRLQLLAHDLEASVERLIEPERNRGTHHLLAGARGALVGAFRNRRCRARCEADIVRRRGWPAAIFVEPGYGIDRKPRISA